MSEIRLHLTLTKERGEKLRAICHARGLAASDLVSAWIDSMGADGKPLVDGITKLKDIMDSVFRKRGGPLCD